MRPTLAGRALALAARAVAALRPAAKPLHPEGRVVTGRLVRRGGPGPTGVPLLDETGEDQVLVRRSRAVGLPERLPDIHGLAVRIGPESGRPVDILLASTGLGAVTRFTLTASRRPESRPMTTLLPYRTATGPVLIAAEALAPGRWRLSWGRPRGGWTEFAVLEAAEDPGTDLAVSFDPVLHAGLGLGSYEWVRALREPAYAAARASRGERPDMAGPPAGTPQP